MKKRIIALVCVVVTLLSLFAVNVSATLGFDNNLSYEHFTWTASESQLYKLDSDVNVGQVIVPYLWHYEHSEALLSGTLYYHMGYKWLPNADFVNWQDLQYSITDSWSRGELIENDPYNPESKFGYMFYYHYTDDGGQPSYVPVPVNNWDVDYLDYDFVNVYLLFTRDGEAVTEKEVMLAEYTYKLESQANETSYGISFTQSGVYECEIRAVFRNLEDRNSYVQTYTTVINSVGFSDDNDEMYQYGYNIGYSDGYNAGYNDGVNSDDEWTVISLLNAIIDAPFRFVRTALDFDIFGVNVGSFVQVSFTLLLIGFVVIKIIGAIV